MKSFISFRSCPILHYLSLIFADLGFVPRLAWDLFHVIHCLPQLAQLTLKLKDAFQE